MRRSELTSPRATARRPAGLVLSLAALLERRWSGYRSALKRCRRKSSTRSVHLLRVQIRRLLSCLALLEALLPERKIRPLQRPLKQQLNALSRVRDTQVQIEMLTAIKPPLPGVKPFLAWLERKERRLTRRGRQTLARKMPGPRRVAKLAQELEDLAEGSERQARSQLRAALRRAFAEVMIHRKRISSTRIAAIHKMRVAFKKFRYMAEALDSVLPLLDEQQRRWLKAYQTGMGEIQDADVLLVRVEKFERRRGSNCLVELGRHLRERRARLATRFVARADRLGDLKPSFSAAAGAPRPR